MEDQSDVTFIFGGAKIGVYSFFFYNNNVGTLTPTQILPCIEDGKYRLPWKYNQLITKKPLLYQEATRQYTQSIQSPTDFPPLIPKPTQSNNRQKVLVAVPCLRLRLAYLYRT